MKIAVLLDSKIVFEKLVYCSGTWLYLVQRTAVTLNRWALHANNVFSRKKLRKLSKPRVISLLKNRYVQKYSLKIKFILTVGSCVVGGGRGVRLDLWQMYGSAWPQLRSFHRADHELCAVHCSKECWLGSSFSQARKMDTWPSIHRCSWVLTSAW